MKIQVYGTGCAKCTQLAQHAEAAAQALGLECQIEKITDINTIIDAGVMSTPGLGLDGEIKSSGKVLTVESIKALLQQRPDPFAGIGIATGGGCC
ncbi:MAG: TM0996/MTH895 family glutaredoxin-like protein [Gammaproteobacteria bacterium]|nr:TM0996/MTH895 family glutaredoxin-like protein [Gammaproteobacteria bacterium]MBU1654886.1 TM0996/MTH895 family glutaredoxin-like protein [Gammaproteobacteria bacterium]MBU1960577.1 TM0996/MTH895 family glutaredoxin-like protein [Gammaproteobacteria bacterium]